MVDLYDVHNARFQQPTAEEMTASLMESFGMTDTPQTDIDTTDPAAVSAALMEPFPAAAIFKDDKGMQYVKYQQVIRRLIRATGNCFDVDVLDHRITPHGATQKGVEKFLILATVKLTIPVLGSSRTQIGVQVAMANTEDLFKGAVSDGIKKCAQAFGVAIELAGDDRELANVHALHAQEPSGAPQRPARLSQVQPSQNATNTQQGGAQRVSGGYPATEPQKNAVRKIAEKQNADPDAWAREQGAASVDALTKPQASKIIETYGG